MKIIHIKQVYKLEVKCKIKNVYKIGNFRYKISSDFNRYEIV